MARPYSEGGCVLVGRDDLGAFEQDGRQVVDVEAGAVGALVDDGVVEVDFAGILLDIDADVKTLLD